MTAASWLRRSTNEQGQALVILIATVTLMSLFAVSLMGIVTGELTDASQANSIQTAFQAAEAGINNYTSKLVEDHLYYGHQVASAESTRESDTDVLVHAGNAWSYDLTWTYPDGKDTWQSLNNNFQYNLEITPPSASSTAITILSTGRPTGDTNTADWRSIQTVVQPSSLADFMMFSNASVSYGATATTNGQIYSNGTVTHDGTATANIYAYGGFSGSVTLQDGAQVYNGSTAVKGAMPNAPISFSGFLASLVSIQNAAQNGGVYLNNTSVAAWQLIFNSNGTFTAQACQPASGQTDVAAATPVCGAATTYNVPSNGAIYSPQTVIVSGVVNGRVTVASNNDLDVGGNISYLTPGQDVLGMIAENNIVVCYWAPSNLTWTGASLAETGDWQSYNSDGSHGTMTYTGSVATYGGGYMTMFTTRVYNYDPNLLFLAPPWFPAVDDSYTTVLFREVAPTP